jgi:mono/diheme cytochrome c family protein
MLPRVLTGLFLYLFVPAVSLAAGEERSSPAEQAKFFETQVLPILQANCFSCHGAEEKIRGSLRLTSREGLLKGGDSGPVISLEKPDESLLLQAINHSDDLKMPPKGKLSQAQIDALTRWVKMGVPWSEGATIVKRSGPPPVDDKARAFWSFRPVARPKVPEVKNKDWVKTPIDAFVLAKLEAAGLQPAPPAAKTALLRRITYDLTGLPPTPAEVDAFLADDAGDAYEKVVDRLLASPRYGEHWARHWLDLVRYAETNGYEFDAVKPNVWRYRDYVTNSFNDDKPYDRFVKEQLAGDEMEPATTEGIIATGYYRLAPFDSGAPDRLQAMYDGLDDMVATTGQVFLGLTVNCARCHDHKIDPFPQKDYYRMLAFFHNVSARASQKRITLDVDQDVQSATVAQYKQQVADLKKAIKEFEDALIPHLTGGELDDFKNPDYRVDIARKHVPEHVPQQDFEYYSDRVRLLAQLEKRPPSALAQALCVSENGRTPPETFILLRGSPRSKGDKVEPGFPSVLTTKAPVLPEPGPDAKTTGRRKVLADWIADKDNPLTTRVMANRLWQYHFGRGIVRSSSDFGYRGTPPTHPELLDWLASEFVERGWKLKAMHKLLVTSNAYKMSSRPDSAALAKDPENDLFWRFDLRRLSAEEVRDSILAVSGNLNLSKMGGPSIYPRISAEVLAGQSRPGSGWGPSTPEEQARRSVYVHVKRTLTVPILGAFDAADPDASCPVRFTTTQPTQALGMLNGEFLNGQAKIFADDLRKKAGDDPAAQVRLALRRATQREPTAKEIERGVAFMARMRDRHELSAEEALRSFCLIALNLNEFVYLN